MSSTESQADDQARTARDLEARYEGLIRAAVDGVILIDQRGLIEVFNPAAERIFGYAAADVRGHNITMLMPQADAARHDGFADARDLVRRETHPDGALVVGQGGGVARTERLLGEREEPRVEHLRRRPVEAPRDPVRRDRRVRADRGRRAGMERQRPAVR